jgi:hypothetical protein
VGGVEDLGFVGTEVRELAVRGADRSGVGQRLIAAAGYTANGGGLVRAQDDLGRLDGPGGGGAEYVDEPGTDDAVADHVIAADGAGERGLPKASMTTWFCRSACGR